MLSFETMLQQGCALMMKCPDAAAVATVAADAMLGIVVERLKGAAMTGEWVIRARERAALAARER